VGPVSGYVYFNRRQMLLLRTLSHSHSLRPHSCARRVRSEGLRPEAAAAAAAGIALKQFRRTTECVLGYRLKGCDTEAHFLPSWDTMLRSTPPQQRPSILIFVGFISFRTNALCGCGSTRPSVDSAAVTHDSELARDGRAACD
jgi:hypothetical protein